MQSKGTSSIPTSRVFSTTPTISTSPSGTAATVPAFEKRQPLPDGIAPVEVAACQVEIDDGDARARGDVRRLEIAPGEAADAKEPKYSGETTWIDP